MELKKIRSFFQVLSYRFLWVNLILIFVSFYLSLVNPLFSPFLFVLLSNFYDMIGYYIVLKRQWSMPSDVYTALKEDFYVAGYRIIQNLFDYLLLFVIYQNFGFKYALSSFVLKLFGLQDVLFYLFLKIRFPRVWTWLKWTPLGVLKGNLKNSEVLIQSLAGVLIAILISLVL